MKSTQRLQYNRFIDALGERGLVDRETLAHVVQQCTAMGTVLAESLVTDNLVSDYEVVRIACDGYGLPFVPVHGYPPDESALEGLDPDYLRQYGLVPLDRFGKILTVAMPGIVTSEILEGLRGHDGQVMPVVGSVVSNRQWLNKHLPPSDLGIASLDQVGAALPAGGGSEDDWAGIFDAGDEAVQQVLGLDGAAEEPARQELSLDNEAAEVELGLDDAFDLDSDLSSS